jgi:parallel beta-helix repeat protein
MYKALAMAVVLFAVSAIIVVAETAANVGTNDREAITQTAAIQDIGTNNNYVNQISAVPSEKIKLQKDNCPFDDTFITTNMTLAPIVCNVTDIDNNGVLIISGDNVTLDCNGMTLVGSGSGLGIAISGSGVTLKNCIVQKYGTGISANNINVFLTAHIINNSVMYNTGSGIYNDMGSQNVVFENNIASQNYNGITLSGRNNTLTNNLMSGNTYNLDINMDGFVLYTYLKETKIDTTNLVDGRPVYHLKNVNGLTFDSSSNAGFFSCLDCKNIFVKDLVFGKNSHGAILFNGDDITFSNNIVGVNKNGVYGFGTKNLYILNNTISQISGWGSGIYLFNVTWAEIRENSIYQNSMGINIVSSGSSGMIKQNNIFSNQLDGIMVQGVFMIDSNSISSNRNGITAFSPGIFSNNTLYNNKFGIEIDANNIAIYNNTISNSGDDAIVISPNNANTTILNNKIISNACRGVYVNQADKTRIENNIFTKNMCDAIKLTASDYTTIINNTIENSTGNGVYFDSASHNLMTYNNLRFNKQDGVFVYASSVNNTLTNNTICKNSKSGISMNFFPNTNYIYLNNFLNNMNSPQANNSGTNYYDNGVIGNHWTDYNGTDSNNDSIGDTPYYGLDNFPLMQPNPNAPSCGSVNITPPKFHSVILTGTNNKDVKISWYATPNDSTTGTKYYLVERYNEFPWGGQFVPPYSVANITANGSAIYSVIDSDKGDGDRNNYFYSVRAFHNNTYYVYSWENDYVWGGAKFVRTMNIHDFISFPVIQWNNSLPEVLKTLDFDYVRYYNSSNPNDPWKSYYKNKPFNDLNYLDYKMGFWINLLSDDNFTVAGLVPKYTVIPLYSSWNMVGYPSFTNRTVSEALAGIPWTAVEGFDPTPPYYLKKLSGNDTMSVGNAYWIEVSNNAIWNVTN